MESFVNLDTYWLILKRRWLPASLVFLLCALSSSVLVLLKKPAYVAEEELLLKKENANSSITQLGKEIVSINPLYAQSIPLDTETEILSSFPIVQKTIDQLNLKDDKKAPLDYESFKKKLEITKVRGTDILTISYKDGDPDQAATIVNTLMDIYIQDNMTYNRAEAKTAREFIETQLPLAEASVSQLERRLREFKEKYQVVNLEEEEKSAVRVIEDLQKQINEAQSQLADVETQTQEMLEPLGMDLEQAINITSLSQNTGIQSVLEELQEAKSQLAVKQTRLTTTHPQVQNLKEEVEALEELLQGRIFEVFGWEPKSLGKTLQVGELQQKLASDLVKLEAKRLGLSSEIEALSQIEKTYKERLNIIPQLEQKQKEIDRKLEASQASYSLLLNKLQDVQIAENQNLGNVRIISPAPVPEKSDISKKILYLVVGFTFSMMMAAVIAIVLEIRDKSLKTTEETKEIFDLPTLGIIPLLVNRKKRWYQKDTVPEIPSIVVKEQPRSAISEYYRMLQANLKFVNPEQLSRVIVVTSSIAQEGKSTVSVNLAVAMAQSNHKVLLIDADMRRPCQHKIWGVNNYIGLSNVIVEGIDYTSAMEKVMFNLDLLTSGIIPPSPASLLQSPKINSLMENLANIYDFIIIDSPPLTVVADAITLGKISDGVILVARPTFLDLDDALVAKELLEQSKQKILGLVINGVMSHNKRYDYYYSELESVNQIRDVAIGNPQL